MSQASLPQTPGRAAGRRRKEEAAGPGRPRVSPCGPPKPDREEEAWPVCPVDALLAETSRAPESGAGLTGLPPGMEPSVWGSGQMAFLSNLLATSAFIAEHAERAALCFVSGVCVGLLFTLAALVLAISWRADCRRLPRKKGLTRRRSGGSSSSSSGDSDSDSDEDSVGGRCSASLDGSTRRPWLYERPPHRNVFTSAEELERAQRLEERERILREIWLNGQPDGPAPAPRSLNRYY
ncbi:protein eva-1 homolog A isoform X2 [Monodelphis domestica]|uniref:EVA1 domain-containing protein n=1 Tax=Monodelphis domestica TaxID=13616 RepID=A0A5F8HE04_MONDO|nr:protein eva-1 homolog A isoform X2 [Monodelphis domestica]